MTVVCHGWWLCGWRVEELSYCEEESDLEKRGEGRRRGGGEEEGRREGGGRRRREVRYLGIQEYQSIYKDVLRLCKSMQEYAMIIHKYAEVD